MKAQDVVILQGARTPFGSFLGGLAKVTPTELGVTAATEAIGRNKVEAEQVDHIVFGNVLPTGSDSSYLARHVGLKAGCRTEVPALNVNRACGSGMEAVIQGARALMLGEATLSLVGGAENLSMTPYTMRGVRQGWKMHNAKVDDWLTTALFDPMAGCSIAQTVEALGVKRKIGREQADEWAIRGHELAADAQSKALFAGLIAPVHARKTMVMHDENIRPETNAEVLATLRGLFGPTGILTAGNSAGITDGGAALLLTTSERANADDVVGRLVSWATVGIEPMDMALGPVGASQRALADAGWTVDDLDLIELNDSFAVQAIAVCDELGLDVAKVNPWGGAIALGHPMAATGTRLVLALCEALKQRGGGRGLATLCVGGGQGMAICVEV